MQKFKTEAISFAQTFVSLFLTTVGAQIVLIPHEQLLSGEAFTGAFIVGLVSAAARSALKAAWERVMPVKLGGRSKLKE